MLIIDTHAHAAINWFQPVETLVNEMDLYGVSGTVLIQHAGAWDNNYLFECAARYPGRLKVVVQIDPQDPDPEGSLEKLRQRGAAGVRIRAISQYRTPDPYGLWKRAGALGMVVSSGGPGAADQYGPNFKKILDACPDTHVQIEHLAAVGHTPEPWDDYRAALESARWPNTSLKVPGLGEIMRRPALLPSGYPFEDKPPPLFEMALEAFGARRLCWGSDFPPVAGREGYMNCLRGVQKHPAFASGDTLDWVMGKTAQRIWNFAFS